MGEIGRCRSCNAPVRFVLTEKGKLMPLDPAPVRGPLGGNVVIRDGRAHVLRAGETWEGDLFISHFVTCPEARAWGKGRARKAADRAIARVRENHD